MKQILRMMLMLLIPIASMMLVGCDEAEDAAEETGEMIEEGVEESADAVEEAGDEIDQSM